MSATDRLPAPAPPAFIQIREAARRLSLCPDSVRKLIGAGHLRGHRLPGLRTVLISVAELERLLNQGKTDASSGKTCPLDSGHSS